MIKITDKILLMVGTFTTLCSFGAYLIGRIKASGILFEIGFISLCGFLFLNLICVLFKEKSLKRIDQLIIKIFRLIYWLISPMITMRFILFFLVASFGVFVYYNYLSANYVDWIMNQKEKGLIYEINLKKGQDNNQNKRYESRLLQNNLELVQKGYELKDIFPDFKNLSKEFIQQLEFMGVDYVVYKIQKNQAPINIISEIEPKVIFDDAFLFKIPKYQRYITLLYGEKFTENAERKVNTRIKWLRSSNGKVYVHNHLRKPILVNIKANLITISPATIKILNESSNEILWEGDVSFKETPVEIKNVPLNTGKNVLKFDCSKNQIGADRLISHLVATDGFYLGLQDMQIIFAGKSIEAIVDSQDIKMDRQSKYQKWLSSLPDEIKILEYPLAYKEWADEIAYSSFSKEQDKHNMNFYFNYSFPEVSKAIFRKDPFPGLSWWAKILGINYIVIHKNLYAEDDIFIEKEWGFIPVFQFEDIEIYRPKTDRVRLESELAMSRSGDIVSDRDALGRQLARKIGGKKYSNESSYLVYGPYAPLTPGRYQATYRLKAEKKLNKLIAFIDVSADSGRRILAHRDIRADEFDQPLTYQDYTLEFELDRITVLEFRVRYNGQSIGLWSDYILVEKLDV